MSTPFLSDFSLALVATLVGRDLLEVTKGNQRKVVTYLANYLQKKGQGNSLLSTIDKALLSCDEVEEFYADQETLKGIVEALKYET